MADSNETKDVAPEWFIGLLAILWLVLLGGRWLATPFIMLADPKSADLVATLDRELLLKVYLILMSVTLLIPALRFVRKMESANMAKSTPRKGAADAD